MLRYRVPGTEDIDQGGLFDAGIHIERLGGVGAQDMKAVGEGVEDGGRGDGGCGRRWRRASSVTGVFGLTVRCDRAIGSWQ